MYCDFRSDLGQLGTFVRHITPKHPVEKCEDLILRWLDGIQTDLRKLAVKNWSVLAQDQDQWRHVVKEAKAHIRL